MLVVEIKHEYPQPLDLGHEEESERTYKAAPNRPRRMAFAARAEAA